MYDERLNSHPKHEDEKKGIWIFLLFVPSIIALIAGAPEVAGAWILICLAIILVILLVQ